MAFEKPKVTIDLDHYNHLIRIEQAYNSSTQDEALKIVMAEIIKTGNRKLLETLKDKGVSFSPSRDGAVGFNYLTVNCNDIKVHLNLKK